MATAAVAREVIDSAGRKVEVPDRIERVMAAGPPASVLIYMLAPEKMIGWNLRAKTNFRIWPRSFVTCPRSGA